MTDILTIGDFSRITHLSVKTLRHYQKVGLLEPVNVDPRTGYRHYTTDQIPNAQVIRRFRKLDMPVNTVKAVLAAPDTDARNELIVAHLDRMESELKDVQTAVASLRSLLEAPSADVAYGELGTYVTQHELTVEGPVREYYLIDGHSTDDQSKWRTEVGWPIFLTGAKAKRP